MASIKDRMIQALGSKGIDTSEIDISKNSQGYWEAHVCGIICVCARGRPGRAPEAVLLAEV